MRQTDRILPHGVDTQKLENGKQLQLSARIPESREFWNMELGRCYFETAVKLDAFEIVQRVKQKILLFHGAQDEIVPVSYARKAAQVGADVELEILPGEGHGFSEKERRRVAEKAAAFILAGPQKSI